MRAHITLERFVTTSSDLAATLAKLRKDAGLSRRQLELVSGVSEETIKAIEYGNNTRPTPDTLRKVADGLATNRALARLDPEAAAEMQSTLMRAAGYMPSPEIAGERSPAPALVDIRAALVARGFRPDQTYIVDQILDDLVDKTDEQRQQLLDALAILLASRGAR